MNPTTRTTQLARATRPPARPRRRGRARSRRATADRGEHANSAIAAATVRSSWRAPWLPPSTETVRRRSSSSKNATASARRSGRAGATPSDRAPHGIAGPHDPGARSAGAVRCLRTSWRPPEPTGRRSDSRRPGHRVLLDHDDRRVRSVGPPGSRARSRSRRCRRRRPPRARAVARRAPPRVTTTAPSRCAATTASARTPPAPARTGSRPRAPAWPPGPAADPTNRTS